MKQKLTTVIIIAAILILAGIAVFTAIRLYELRQQPVAPNVPESVPEAFVSPNGSDSCNKVSVQIIESPSCPRLSQVGNRTCPTSDARNLVTSYSTTYRISSKDGNAHTINYRTSNNYCPTACGTYHESYGGGFSCTDGSPDQSGSGEVGAGTPYDIVVSKNSPSGQACGTYQQDIWIDSVDGNTNCNFKTPDGNVGGWGQCETGVDCTDQPSPTPALTNTCSLSFSLTVPLTACNGTCTANSDCQTGLTCSSGKCRNPSCTSETDCICPTPTPTPASCNNTCTSNAGCESGLICSSGSCRNPSCTTETDCSCPTATPTATPTTTATPTSRPTPTATPEPQLPEAGSTTPTLVGLGLGLILLVVSMVLAI